MKKVKKYVILAVVLLVVAGAAVGGIFAYRKYQQENLIAEAVSVANLNMGWWGDSMSSSGNVSDSHVQSVKLDESKTVAEVKVTEGQEVKIGDPLLVYDTSETQIQIDMKKLELQGIKNDITLAEREIERLKKIKPVSQATPAAPSKQPASSPKKEPSASQRPSAVVVIDVPKKDGKAYNYIDTTAKPYEGKGTVEKPYRFLCTQECYVLGSYLNQLVKKEETAAFEIWSGNSVTEGTLISCWTVNGADWSSVSSDSKWSVATQEELNDGVEIKEEKESEKKEESESSESETNSTEETYTADELKKEIEEKETELKELKINQKGAKLELNSLKKSKKKNTVEASLDGVVRTVGDPENPPVDGSAFIEIAGASGLYVKSEISELMLDQIEVGQEISVSSWSSGQEYTAVITEISEYPSVNRWGYYGEGNPNASYYSYMAYIEDSAGLSNGEDLQVSITPANTGEEQNSLYIDKSYVREENGKSYVLKAGKDNRLEKQYVKTGRILYGSSVEIKSGLTLEDRIAFPYGKTAKEGIKVKAENSEGF